MLKFGGRGPRASTQRIHVKPARLFYLVVLAMVAFAGNSILCRLALKETTIDAVTFTFIRVCSGAIVLTGIAFLRRAKLRHAGSWPSAIALFIYAAAFSFAYVSLSAGTGALLLFAAVQATMILWCWRRGERLRVRQFVGLAIASAGLVLLVLPGVSAPPVIGSVLMLIAGIAWGTYSLRGKTGGDPVIATAGNFLRAVPSAAVLFIAFYPSERMDCLGVFYASISGGIASGLGYVVWYAALPALKAASAATVQLSVPVNAATGGIILLGEPLTARFICASVAVLGGIGLVIMPAQEGRLRR